MNGKNLLERLNEIGKSMSASHSKISSFLLTSGHGAAFLTAAEIALSVGVSESTVVRFARTLGFRGFPELQEFLRANLLETLSPAERLNTWEDVSDDRRLVENVFELEHSNLRVAQQKLDLNALRAMTTGICSARRCYVVGLRSSRAPAMLLGHYLRKILPQVTIITSGDFILEDLSWAAEGDYLVAFSFPRYSEQTIEAIRIARSTGAGTGAITDSTSSPAAQISDHCMTAPVSSNFFGNSMLSAVAITNMLLTFCTREQPESVRENLTRVEKAASLDKRFFDASRGQ